MYHFTWLGLAEGVIVDHRQSLTVVGFNLQALTIAELPAGVPLTIIGLVDGGDEDPPLPAGSSVMVGVQLKSPSGTILVAGQQPTEVAPPQWPDLASRVQVVVSVGVNLPEYGPYVAQMTMQLPQWDEPQIKERTLHVRPVPTV